jgi:transcriptional regulator with XRE-family HTH domain
MPRKITKEKLIQKLVAIRNEAGITQAQLARKLNKAQSFVSKYETGERNLDFLEVIDVFEELGVDPVDQIIKLYRG